jgi:hypothetical protein
LANNLFISYDLKKPPSGERDYKPVFEAIHALGNAKHIELSQYYVNSTLGSQAAAAKVWASMKAGDKLLVIDSTNNTAHWYGLNAESTEFIQKHWLL